MNTISIVCLGSLLLYILISLSFMKKDKGRQLFRMIYSAISLGIIGAVSFLTFGQMTQNVNEYIPQNENVLTHAFFMLMLMIPIGIIMITINLLLKKPRPYLFMIICTVLFVLGTVGAVLYSYFGEKMNSTAWVAMLNFAYIFLPFMLNFTLCGLADTNTKRGLLLHRISLVLEIIACIALEIQTGFILYSLIDIGVTGLVRFVPIMVIGIAMPIIPLLILNHQKAKDDERAGIVKEKFIDFSRLKKKGKKK